MSEEEMREDGEKKKYDAFVRWMDIVTEVKVILTVVN